MPGPTCPPPTERLQFRRYRTDDVESVMSMFSDEESRRWYPTKARRGESLAWITWNLHNYREHGIGLWVIEDRVRGDFLGDCGLTYQDVEGRPLLEIGYHLAAGHRGRGYAVEAASACLAYALDELDAATVCSIVDPRNESSKRVAGTIHDRVRTFRHRDGTWNLYSTDRPTTLS